MSILVDPQTAPHVLSVQKLNTDVVAEVQIGLHVHPELRWFEGHFPGVPLLPGVVQTAWVMEFARLHFALPPQLNSMSNLKFMRFIMPDSKLVLLLRYAADKHELSFEYRDADKVCASGRMRFGS